METSRVIFQPAPSRSAVLNLILRGVLAKVKTWRRTRQAERELLALDDRLLQDIGIDRADITHAVRGYQPKPKCGPVLPK